MKSFFFAGILFAITQLTSAWGQDYAGAEYIAFYGYDDCIRLYNDDVEVVLCPAAGGRVLSYSYRGANVLYLPPGDEGWTMETSSGRGPMNAGRFDIGPEQVVPRRPLLWQGRYDSQLTGARSARMTSQIDPGPQVQIARDFRLASQGSKLECRQTIISAADQPVEYCHWSRTFAVGKGTCIVPRDRIRRFPTGYVRYDPPGRMLNMQPSDPHVQEDGDLLVITDHPENPKLGFDTMAGWLAYQTPNDLLFVKKFPTFPDRAYNEVAGLTISVWYPDDQMVELEPIGPRERLNQKGDSASFTETWYLLPNASGTQSASPNSIAKRVSELR